MDWNYSPAKRVVDPFEEIRAMLPSLPTINPPGFSMSASIAVTYRMVFASNFNSLGSPNDTSWLTKAKSLDLYYVKT